MFDPLEKIITSCYADSIINFSTSILDLENDVHSCNTPAR
uniref:Uncharacterized protein n=1 Tax=Arundo donax TaxID=35708 RepID=A0A0A9GUH6_ARUDO